MLTHKRSLEARQRRDTHKHLLTFSHNDDERKEIVCTKYAISATTNELQKTYGYSAPLSVEPGEVLIDSLGRGTFQRVQGVKP